MPLEGHEEKPTCRDESQKDALTDFWADFMIHSRVLCLPLSKPRKAAVGQD
jgi:hypothetical protein